MGDAVADAIAEQFEVGLYLFVGAGSRAVHPVAVAARGPGCVGRT